MKPVLIETEDALDALCDELAGEPLLAIDTEFFRETSYFPHLGLVQIASPDRIACVDPLAFDARKGLAKLLLNPDVTKIFHACIQDLEVLYQYLGEFPCPLIDTQVAAAMLGAQDQVGYGKLVEAQMGVQLEKSQTRTNWLKRPLTSRQIEYAGDDVLYLIPMYEKLLAELEQKQRQNWLNEDCSRLCTDIERFYPDMNNCWKRTKGASRLNGIELSVCYSVAQWREQHAMKKDLTRRKMLDDESLLNIAGSQPTTVESLKKIVQSGKTRKLNGDEMESLLAAVLEGINRPKAEWPSQERYIPGNEEKTQVRQMLEYVRKRAEHDGIAQGILCSRKEIEKMVSGKRNGQLLNGWRLDYIGKELLAMLDAQKECDSRVGEK